MLSKMTDLPGLANATCRTVRLVIIFFAIVNKVLLFVTHLCTCMTDEGQSGVKFFDNTEIRLEKIYFNKFPVNKLKLQF